MMSIAFDLRVERRYAAAVRTARAAAALMPDQVEGALGLGGMLIDTGSDSGRMALVREGISILEAALPQAPSGEAATFRYNIGTGYSTLGARERGRGPLTRPSTRMAVEHLASAIQEQDWWPDSRVNLANALRHQGRAIEALDILNDVLQRTRGHHQALASRGRCLMDVHTSLRRHGGIAQAALLDYEQAYQIAVDTEAVDYAAFYLDFLLEIRANTSHRALRPQDPSHVERWIWEKGLGLNACPLCRIESPHAFDIYAVDGVLHESRRRPSHTEILEIVNSWHRAYSTARWHLLQAAGVIHDVPDDHVVAWPAVPTARRGLHSGLLTSALTGFHSILDQIAFGLNTIFGLQHKDSSVSFSRMWAAPRWKRPSNGFAIPETRADLHPRLRRSSAPGLSALYHLAWSFEAGEGMYRSLRTLRNTIEHRIVVVTEPGTTSNEGSNGGGSAQDGRVSGHPLQESQHYRGVVDPRDVQLLTTNLVMIARQELLDQTIAMGRLAKAALMYAGGAIWWSESMRARRASRNGTIALPGDVRWVRRE